MTAYSLVKILELALADMLSKVTQGHGTICHIIWLLISDIRNCNHVSILYRYSDYHLFRNLCDFEQSFSSNTPVEAVTHSGLAIFVISL